MNAILQLSSAVVAGALVTLPNAASGHHSMSEFDRSIVTEVEGVVSRISWRNPHILLEVTATDDSGAAAVWYFEGSAVSAQRRRGVTGELIEVGDEVRVAGWPSTRRDQYVQVNHVLLPDGVELLVGGVREPRWSDTAVGSETWVIDPEKVAAPRGDGIFRVWSQGSRAWYFTGRADYKVRKSAAAIAAEWDDITDNPLLECMPPGMPGLMGNPYPMELVQVGDNIELRFEEFDALRTIHIGDVADAADIPPSHLGYSVGHWEGETLVVSTSRVSWPYFDRVGVPQTENVAIHERFTAVENGDRLEYVLTVTEPTSLVEPFVWNAYFVWKRGEEVNRYDCTLEEWASTESTLGG